MKTIIQSISRSIVLGAAFVALSTSTISAHVVVRPNEVKTAAFQTFTIGVPNEKTVPTTSVRLLVPAGLEHVSPSVKPGWQISVEKTGEGESTHIQSITWSNGSIDTGLRDDFTFSAKTPSNPTDLEWKAYQTYQDGVTVAWDQKGEAQGHGDTGPFSVTKVVTETSETQALQQVEHKVNEAHAAANRSLYIAAASVVIALTSIALITRKPV